MARPSKYPYKLSTRQKNFVRKAEKEGFDIRWDYSGRFMFGEKCPAVVCKAGSFGYRGALQDSMGLDVVIYMPV